MTQRLVPLSRQEIGLLLTSLSLAASRRESQARVVKHGAHHDDEARSMRELRVKLMKEGLLQ